MEVTLKLLNKEGLHARPAGQLVKTANLFQSQITLEYAGRAVNAKSVIHLMSLGLPSQAEFKIKAEGTDQEAALQKLTSLVENSFELSES